jgi:hypothetical protein
MMEKITTTKPTEMENNKQQTPVDWFSVKRDVLEIEVRLGKLSADEYAEELTKAEQKAKEMEKERMIEFAQSYAVIHCMGDITKNAEDYYSETYGDDKK